MCEEALGFKTVVGHLTKRFFSFFSCFLCPYVSVNQSFVHLFIGTNNLKKTMDGRKLKLRRIKEIEHEF